MTNELTKKAVTFTVTTNAPGFTLRLEDKEIDFAGQQAATLELNETWEYIVYYELHGAELGHDFKLEITEASRPVEFKVETDSGSVFGFTGFVVRPASA